MLYGKATSLGAVLAAIRDRLAADTGIPADFCAVGPEIDETELGDHIPGNTLVIVTTADGNADDLNTGGGNSQAGVVSTVRICLYRRLATDKFWSWKNILTAGTGIDQLYDLAFDRLNQWAPNDGAMTPQALFKEPMRHKRYAVFKKKPKCDWQKITIDFEVKWIKEVTTIA